MQLFVTIRALAERYRASVARTVLVLAVAAVAVGWEVEPVKAAFVGSGALLLVILALIIDISIALSKVISIEYQMAAFRDDNKIQQILTQHIEKENPKKADLLEYSAQSVHFLIEELAKKSQSAHPGKGS